LPFDAVDRDHVDLGQRHGAAADAEQFDDFQVLAGLRHRPVVGGDDEQREVDAGGAGQHVVHQLLVPRHVDETERRRVGVAEIDGDAARLLFLQAVAVDAGQRLDQRAVVDCR
jgi:hypothetical protein